MSISMHQSNPQFDFGKVTSQAIQQQRALNMENKLIDLVKKPMVDMEIEKFNQQKENDKFMKAHLLNQMERKNIGYELEEGLSDIEGQWFRPNELGWNPFSWFMDSEKDQKEALTKEYREKYKEQFDPLSFYNEYEGNEQISSPVVQALLNETVIDKLTPSTDLNQLLGNMTTTGGF